MPPFGTLTPLLMLSFRTRICLRSVSICSVDSLSSLDFSVKSCRIFMISMSRSRIDLISRGNASYVLCVRGRGERDRGERERERCVKRARIVSESRESGREIGG